MDVFGIYTILYIYMYHYYDIVASFWLRSHKTNAV